MSKLRVGAIIPVKTFSKAKTRLNLPPEKTEIICKIMLESVLKTLSLSDVIEKIVLVSRDEEALNLGKKFGNFVIYDQDEIGVNNAVRLADDYFDGSFDATVVFPQDIPLMKPDDVQTLFEMRSKLNSVLVVPSRKFDGTNALFRMPPKIMETHYDEDSFRIHISTAENKKANPALVLIRRIMLDVDDQLDLNFVLSNSNSEVSQLLRSALNS